jgi:hypothetical protein
MNNNTVLMVHAHLSSGPTLGEPIGTPMHLARLSYDGRDIPSTFLALTLIVIRKRRMVREKSREFARRRMIAVQNAVGADAHTREKRRRAPLPDNSRRNRKPSTRASANIAGVPDQRGSPISTRNALLYST